MIVIPEKRKNAHTYICKDAYWGQYMKEQFFPQNNTKHKRFIF